MTEENILVRKIDSKVLQIIDEEAKKNSMSRNQLVQNVLAEFAKDVEQKQATKNLIEPLEDVKNQINLLRTALDHSTENVSYDLKMLTEVNKKFTKILSQFLKENYE